MIKMSLFKNPYDDKPEMTIEFSDFVTRIREGHWQDLITKLRAINDPAKYKKFKEKLPGVTISAIFKTREKGIPLNKKLSKHTGNICLDIDKKDNPKMRVNDLIDKDCLCQFVSCGGEGIKIVYRCEETRDAAVHRRIYDAAVKRLEDKGIKLKIDPIVKSIASLQFVSYDPEIYYFPKTKLVIKALPPIKIKKTKPSEDQEKDLEQLDAYLTALGDTDITDTYEKWLHIGMGLTYSLGSNGREVYHRISKNYPDYDEGETNEKYDALLEQDPEKIERPITLKTVFQYINEALPKAKAIALAKKYNKGHSVGEGEDMEQPDLQNFVRYRLFLFKKVPGKQAGEVLDLMPAKLNLNEFEKLLRAKGFYRYEKIFVQVVDNIVKKVDGHDILRIVTEHVEHDGDYHFTYKGEKYEFSWEELVHLWREIRGQNSTFSQLSSSLTHWQPRLLKDTIDTSYIPYSNGVLQVNKKGREIIPYNKMPLQIWEERILGREFKYTQEVGAFEEFFANICGRGTTRKKRIQSKEYHRNLWYYGYMLHTFKKRSMARAWVLYDIRAGNNGRTGKSILGQALGKIRSVVIIDGKQTKFDADNRFALQKVTPWTEIVFIDDPKIGFKLGPLFNMISGDTDAEAKGKDMITVSLKYMIAANWFLEMEGQSESGRQFITQVDDFYVKYSEAHNNDLQPIVKYHGKEFFSEWDDKEWQKFDSFCVRALLHYYTADAPENTIIGNAQQMRFVQFHGADLFYELTAALHKNAIKDPGNKEGFLISQQIMVMTLRNSPDMENANRVKLGRTVRDYLKAIGAGEPKMTTNQNGMLYKINVEFKNLKFGELQDEFKTPNL